MKSMMSQKKRTVVILQRVLPHYRIAFFDRLASNLMSHGVQLRVLYGQERPGTVPRTVHPERDWAEYATNTYWCIWRTELVWQNCLKRLGSPDLVIIEQANRLLVNYPLLLWRVISDLRVAYWGHGRNCQSETADALRERIKRRLIKAVDWWFAYTQMSAEMVSAAGYPRERITVVENTIDTDEFVQAMTATTERQIDELRIRLGIVSCHIALYCGGMYPDKRLPFLLESIIRLREIIPDLNVVMIGSGPDAQLVQNAAAKHSWIHYVGPVYGPDRATYFAMSDVMLMPGLVGLAIVDSFVAGLPMVTTNVPIHSPEIAYLQHGVNGLITPHVVDDYVDAVSACLLDERLATKLQEGCARSASRYTIDNMVDNFSRGILSCLR